MVVRLHLERRHPTIADIDHPGVLPRPLHHARPRRRELPQMHARRLVRTVLRPHHGEDAQLRVIRLAPEDLENALILVRSEAVRADDVRSDGGVLHAGEILSVSREPPLTLTLSPEGRGDW